MAVAERTRTANGEPEFTPARKVLSKYGKRRVPLQGTCIVLGSYHVGRVETSLLERLIVGEGIGGGGGDGANGELVIC